jgi:hypothetical protein
MIATAVLALAAAAPASADSTLVGQWNLDEGSGTVAHDRSGYGNNGAVSGGTQWVTGYLGGGLSFDGTGQVQVPDSSSLQSSTTAVSVSAWVEHTGSPGAYKYILAKGASGCIAASFGLYTGSAGGMIFYVSGNSGSTYTLSPDAGTSVWNGNWHHVAGTFDGTTVRLYLDGAQVGSGSTASGPISYGLSTTNDVFIGQYAGCGGLGFTGQIFAPKVWERTLSASQVLADMNPYTWTGFFSPVANQPAINVVKGGNGVPVKFSLGGNFGLGILAAGSPASSQVPCSGGTDNTVSQSVTAGSSGLQYDPSSNQYTYVWKTSSAWSGTCRRLHVTLNDGSTHSATFQFK